MSVIVCAFNEVLDHLSREPVGAVLSIEHPGVKQGARGYAPRLCDHNFDTPQLILTFWDVEQAVENGPSRALTQQGLQFASDHQSKGPLLVHCAAGKARSAALALGVIADRNPHLSGTQCLDLLLEVRPIAAPNITVVAFADDILGRGGALVQAVLDEPGITLRRNEANAARERQINDRRWLALNGEKAFHL